MKQTTSEDEATKVAAVVVVAAAAAAAVPVGRCLFPPVDRRQNRKDLRRLLQKIEDAQTLRWNFDFKECRPLEGRFEWKKPDDRNGGGGGDDDDDDDADDDAGLSTTTSQIPDLPGHSRCSAAESRCFVGCTLPGEADGEKRHDSTSFPTTSTELTTSSRISPSSTPSPTSESTETSGPTVRGKRQSTLCRYYRVKKRRPERVK